MRSIDVLLIWAFFCGLFLIYELQNTGSYTVSYLGLLSSGRAQGILRIEDLNGDKGADIIFTSSTGAGIGLTTRDARFEVLKEVSLASDLELGENAIAIKMEIFTLGPHKYILVLTNYLELVLLDQNLDMKWSVTVPDWWLTPEASKKFQNQNIFEVGLIGVPVPVWKDDEAAIIVSIKRSAQHKIQYFCFDFKTGDRRWMSSPEENGEDHPSFDKDESWRLNAVKTSTHLKSLDWTIFAESVMEVLPHSWSTPKDAKLQLAHFRRSYYNDEMKQYPNHAKAVNTLVSSFSFGMQAINLYTGHVITELPLHFGAVYAQLSTNITLSRVWANYDAPALQHNEPGQSPCEGTIGSMYSHGDPEPARAFSLCSFGENMGLFRNLNNDHLPFQTTRPLIINRQTKQEPTLTKPSNSLVFWVNDGTVTSRSPKGGVEWSAQLQSLRWDKHEPIFRKFNLRSNTHKEWILCLTDRQMVVFDEHGSVWAERALTFKPGDFQDVVFADLNGDGITDIAVVASSVYHFYSLTKSLYSVSWYAVPIMLALALLAVIYPNIKYAKQELRRFQETNANAKFK